MIKPSSHDPSSGSAGLLEQLCEPWEMSLALSRFEQRTKGDTVEREWLEVRGGLTQKPLCRAGFDSSDQKLLRTLPSSGRVLPSTQEALAPYKTCNVVSLGLASL